MGSTVTKYFDADKELCRLLFGNGPTTTNEVIRRRGAGWLNDNSAAFKLMVDYHAFPSSHPLSDSIIVDDQLEYFEDHKDKELAIRYCIVLAVIKKLQKEKCFMDALGPCGK